MSLIRQVRIDYVLNATYLTIIHLVGNEGNDPKAKSHDLILAADRSTALILEIKAVKLDPDFDALICLVCQ